MRIFVRGCLVVTAALIVLTVTGIAILYRAARQEPKFYRRSLEAVPTQLAEAGDELEQEVLELRNESRDEGKWEAEFTDEQINGWLAVDLPEKFPDWLPDGVDAPRVQISEGELSIAARYQDSVIDSVITIDLQIVLTDEPNTLAVKIEGVHAGAVPIPARQFLDRISDTAERGDIPLRWAQQDEYPVALLTIPVEQENGKRQVVLDSLELREGAVFLAGRTEMNGEERATEIAQRSSPSDSDEKITSQ